MKHLKEKIEFMLHDEDTTKEDFAEILFMAIEEGISVREAIEDYQLDNYFEEQDDSYGEYCDRKYDEYKERWI